MQFGFVTNELKHFALAKKLGFDGIETVCYHDGLLKPITATEKDAKELKAKLDDAGIKMLSLAHYDYRLGENCREALEGCLNIIRLCPVVGTDLLTINAWAPPEANDEDQLKWLAGYTNKMIKVAEEVNVRIAVENCPHGQGNYARSPYHWKKMFQAISSPRYGLQYDPSHLIWQGVDYVSALRKFAPHVMAFHAKDTEVRYDVLKKQGMVRSDWWRFRVPGLGDGDWKSMFRLLIDMQYDGPMIIEHEDPVLAGPRIEEGLEFGLNFLKRTLSGG